MSFWNLAQSVQTRVLKYVLNRTVGLFFKHDLDLTQLNVQISSSGGAVNLTDVELSVEALNGLIGNLPFKFVEGKIGSISFTLPWTNLWQSQSAGIAFKIDGIRLVVEAIPACSKPIANQEPLSSEHAQNKLTKTLFDYAKEEFAGDEEQDIVKGLQQTNDHKPYEHYDQRASLNVSNPGSKPDDAGIEGVQMLTEFINRLLSRIEVVATNTQLVIQHISPYSGKPVGLELFIPQVNFRDETPETAASTSSTHDQAMVAPIAMKSVTFTGLTVRMREYQDLQALHDDNANYDVLILFLGDSDWLRLKLKTSAGQHLNVPAVDVYCFMKVLRIALSPHNLHILAGLSTLIGSSSPSPSPPANLQPVSNATPATFPDLRIKVEVRQAQVICWTVDSISPPAVDPERPHANIWSDDLLVNGQPSTDSHISLDLSNVNAEIVQGLGKTVVEVLVQTMTANEVLPASLTTATVAARWPFPIKPSVPVLAFTSSPPTDTVVVAPLGSTLLASAANATVFVPHGGPDIMFRFEKNEDTQDIDVKLRPMLLRLDVRLLDRLQHFFVAPAIVSDIEQQQQPVKPVTALVTSLSFSCPLVRLDLATPRVIIDDTVEDFKPGLYLYPQSAVVDIQDVMLSVQDFSAPSKVDVSFAQILVHLRQAAPSPQTGYTMTAIALIDSGSTKTRPNAVIELRGLLPDLAHSSWSTIQADPIREQLDNPSWENQTADRSQIYITSEIGRVVAHITRSQFIVADLIFNEISEWAPQMAQTLSTRKAVPPQAIYYACRSDTDDEDDITITQADARGSDSDDDNDTAYNSSVVKPHFLCLAATVGQIYATLQEDEMSGTSNPHTFAIELLQTKVFRVIEYHGARLNFLSMVTDDLSLVDSSSFRQEPVQLIGRTTTTVTAPKQMLHFALTASWPEEHTKIIQVYLKPQEITLFYMMESEWMTRLPALAEEPAMPGLYAQFTNRSIQLTVEPRFITIEYRPKYDAFRLALNVPNAQFTSTIIPDSPTVGLTFKFEDVALWLSDWDGAKQVNASIPTAQKGEETDRTDLFWAHHWRLQGFARALYANSIEMYIRTSPSSIGPITKLEITIGNVFLDTCADSFQTLTRAIDYLVDTKDLERIIPQTSNDPDVVHGGDTSIEDLFASLDNAAFGVDPSLQTQVPSIQKIRSSSINVPTPAPAPAPVAVVTASPEDLSSWDVMDDDFGKTATVDDDDDDFGIGLPPPLLPTPGYERHANILSNQTVNHGFDEHGFDEDFDKNQDNKEEEEELDIVFNEPDLPDLSEEMPELATPEESQLVFGADNAPDYLIRVVDDGPLDFREDHFTVYDPISSVQPSKRFPNISLFHLQIQFESVSWRMYAGLDFKQSFADKEDQDNDDNNRSAIPWLEVLALGLSITRDTFAETEQSASHMVISARDLKILDHIQQSSWKSFLTYWRPSADQPPRETGSQMLWLELTNVRPNPTLKAQETRVKLSVLPLRLYVDQRAIDFMINFFCLKTTSRPGPFGPAPPPQPSEPTFFQLVEIGSVGLKVDYKPEVLHYDSLFEGQMTELIKLFKIEGAEIHLASVKLAGISGFVRLLEGIQNVWVPRLMDPRQSGAGIASGITIVGSFVNFGGALLNMILMPIRQYQEDGRAYHGFKQGAGSLLKTLTLETIKLSTKLVVGTQIILVAAENTFSSDSTRGHSSSDDTTFEPSIYASQPANIDEGLQQGFKTLSANLGQAFYSICTVPMIVYKNEGTAASIRTAVQAVPTAVLKPIIGVSDAVGKVLMGIRNSVEPSIKEDMDEKYKS